MSYIWIMFQFLIGWLQTMQMLMCGELLARFQFLIGWLQTNNLWIS